MLFCRKYPNILLNQYIKNYWCIEGNASYHIREMMPQAGVCLCFQTNNFRKYQRMSNIMVPQKYGSHQEYLQKVINLNKTIYDTVLIGSHQEMLFEITQGDIYIIGVEFVPGAFNLFFDLEEKELTERIISISEINSIELKAMEEIITNKKFAEATQILDTYLLQKINKKSNNSKFNILKNTIKVMDITNPNFSIQRLSDSENTNTKHYYRLFKDTIGISTQQFISIEKYRKAIEIMSQNTEIPLTYIAQQSGYYDLNHFDKTCKKICGQNAHYILKNIKDYNKGDYMASDFNGTKVITLLS